MAYSIDPMEGDDFTPGADPAARAEEPPEPKVPGKTPFWRLAFMVGGPFGGLLPAFGKAGMWIGASAPAWEKVLSGLGGLAIGVGAGALIAFDPQYHFKWLEDDKRPAPAPRKDVDRDPVERPPARGGDDVGLGL